MRTSQIIEELERELKTREKLYPYWIREQKISETVAKHRIDALTEAIAILSEKDKAEDTQLTLSF